GGGVQSSRPERNDQQERSHRRRLAQRAVSAGSAQVGASRLAGDGDTQGTGSMLHQPGRRLDPSDAASQGHLPGTSHRHLWPYVGLAVVTRSSADQEIVEGKLRRRKRAPLTRGLNRNHNRVLKNVFKGPMRNANPGRAPVGRPFTSSMTGRSVP